MPADRDNTPRNGVDKCRHSGCTTCQKCGNYVGAEVESLTAALALSEDNEAQLRRILDGTGLEAVAAKNECKNLRAAVEKVEAMAAGSERRCATAELRVEAAEAKIVKVAKLAEYYACKCFPRESGSVIHYTDCTGYVSDAFLAAILEVAP